MEMEWSFIGIALTKNGHARRPAKSKCSPARLILITCLKKHPKVPHEKDRSNRGRVPHVPACRRTRAARTSSAGLPGLHVLEKQRRREHPPESFRLPATWVQRNR